MKFRKTIALCVSIVILAGCAVSGTLAFPSLPEFLTELFLDTTTEENVPKIDIKLNIDEVEGAQIFPGKSYQKKVSITNSVKSTDSVYAWFTYAVPKTMLEKYGTTNARPLTISFAENSGWKINEPVYGEKTYREIVHENQKYIEFTCIYDNLLGPGEQTPVCMESIMLDVHVGQGNRGEYVWMENGVEQSTLLENSSLPMPFHAYAVGAEGFANAQEAYEIYNSGNAGSLLTAEEDG